MIPFCMRKGEILNLTWDRVDLKRGFIRLTPEDTKTREGRLIPLLLSAELEETFRDLARTRALRDPRVFLRDGKPILDVDGAFQAACREAKITNFRVHDFRHTAITNMRRAGIDQLTIMKLPATRRWSASPGTTASVSQTCKAAARQFNTYLTLAHQTASAVASDQLKELSVTA